MATISEAERILNAAVTGIPIIAQKIAALPIENHAEAFVAAEQIYLKIVKELGCEEEASENWVAQVMLRLRAEVAENGLIKQKPLTGLVEELVPTTPESDGQ